MISKARFNSNVDEKKPLESDNVEPLSQQPSNRFSIPTVAGFILIIAGIFAFIFWIQFFSIDLETIESIINDSNIKNLGYNITSQQIKQTYDICGTIGIVTSVLAILSGFLSIKRKKWGIAMIGGIPLLLVSLLLLIFTVWAGVVLNILIICILSFLGIILIVKSKQEFQ